MGGVAPLPFLMLFMEAGYAEFLQGNSIKGRVIAIYTCVLDEDFSIDEAMELYPIIITNEEEYNEAKNIVALYFKFGFSKIKVLSERILDKLSNKIEEYESIHYPTLIKNEQKSQ